MRPGCFSLYFAVIHSFLEFGVFGLLHIITAALDYPVAVPMTSYDATKHCKISLSGIFFFNRGNLKNNIVLFFLSLSVRKHALRCDVSFSCRAYEIKMSLSKVAHTYSGGCSYLT